MRMRAESTWGPDPKFRSWTSRAGLVIAGGLGAMVGVFALVLAVGSAGAKSSPNTVQAVAARPIAPTAAKAPELKVSSEEPHTGVPTVDVSSLPVAPVGTLSLSPNAAGHRLYVDGAMVAKGSAVVSCGKHLVKVGSRGRPMNVDVPCGADVVVGR
jgi:hypothetical protein